MVHLDSQKIHKDIDQCLCADQHRFRQRLRKLSQLKKSKKTSNDTGQKLLADIAQSTDKVIFRRQNLPSPSYPAELPVVDAREEIMAAITANQVTIICGETGSGKTTQLPKMCLELGRGVAGKIGHTQPRRIAARSVAARIASELNSELGNAVGYKVRFADKLSDNTYLKLMTDGILLAEIQTDPYLNQYDTLIIDEAHERSLNIDFLLGYLKNILPRRPDLKLIITSATIDPERFSHHFDNAPIIFAEGRSYPVELRYRPLAVDEESGQEADLQQAVIDASEELATAGDGDILVFLSGERDIREISDALTKHIANSKRLRGTEILPLFARLSAAEQQRIFASHQQRRIILATNVAETSLTVPGIRYVIDTGLARISRYSLRSKIQRLPIEAVSQASANQRKGRCGREAAGICIRLFTEEDFDARPEFTEPEIIRTNLASVILQMEAMHIGHIENFPFVEVPDKRLITDGYRLLHELGAVDESHKMTRLGRKMARFPIDPKFARMLIAAEQEACLAEVLTIVSALSVQDPRERPMAFRQAADERHKEFQHEQSDFLAFTNLWAFYQVQSKRLSQSKLRKMCRDRFLSYMRLREWNDVRKQLLGQLAEMGLKLNEKTAGDDNIHRAVLAGLLSNIAVKGDQREYLGTRNRKLNIFPGSALFKTSPKWVMSAEVVETTKVYSRCVARIQPEWIEKQAQHLLKRSYHSASWEKRRAQVGAYERSTLYGLLINPKKRVNYGPINPAEAREIFIREALVNGDYLTKAAFFAHNQKLIDDVVALEDKSRRRDILVEAEDLYHFYAEIIPEGIYSGPLFEKWRAEFEIKHPRGLFFSATEIMLHDAEAISVDTYPDHLELASVALPLSYCFEPGSNEDGVTMTIPIALLNRVPEVPCEWLVPGMLKEKMTDLIKSLPKNLRKNFVPVPEYAQACFEALKPAEAPLVGAMTTHLLRMTGVDIPATEWGLKSLSPFLQMRFKIVDAKNNEIACGRDLKILKAKYNDQVEAQLSQSTANPFERDEVSDWNFGDLPECVEIDNAGIKMQGYPALALEGSKITVRVLASEKKAQLMMRTGLRALYKKVCPKEVKYLRRNLRGFDAMSFKFAPFGNTEALREDLVDATFDQTFIDIFEVPRTREKFYEILNKQKSLHIQVANQICETTEKILAMHLDISKRVGGNLSLSWIEAVTDIKDQIAYLIFPGFVTKTPGSFFVRIPLYLQAINLRLDSLDKAPDRDRLRRAELLPLWEKCKTLLADEPDDEVINLRWAMEELRISIFAQSLGTVVKVSPQRIEKQIQILIDKRR